MIRIENNRVIAGPEVGLTVSRSAPVTLAERASRVAPLVWIALGFSLGVLYVYALAGATSRGTFWALLTTTVLLAISITARMFPLPPGGRR